MKGPKALSKEKGKIDQEHWVEECRDFWRKNYHIYLQSPYWKSRRDRAMKAHGPTCCVCKGPATQVHHLTYARLGNERISDLAPVCKVCHEKVTINNLTVYRTPGQRYRKEGQKKRKTFRKAVRRLEYLYGVEQKERPDLPSDLLLKRLLTYALLTKFERAVFEHVDPKTEITPQTWEDLGQKYRHLLNGPVFAD